MGRSGLQVSEIGLGCNTFGSALDAAGAQAVVGTALDEGVTFFDTADCYGDSEAMLGAALAPRRHEVVIATKFGFALARGPMRSGASRKYVVQACEASLRRLGTDHIDLYYQHMPDPLVPIDETIAALDKLVADGKVLYAGVSNFYAWQLVDAVHATRAHPGLHVVSQQVMWNLLDRGVEREILPACEAHGVGIVTFQPLAAGMLTGKYRRGEAPPADTRLGAVPRLAEIHLTEANFTTVERVAEWCRERGRAIADVALGVAPDPRRRGERDRRRDRARAGAQQCRCRVRGDELRRRGVPAAPCSTSSDHPRMRGSAGRRCSRAGRARRRPTGRLTLAASPP